MRDKDTVDSSNVLIPAAFRQEFIDFAKEVRAFIEKINTFLFGLDENSGLTKKVVDNENNIKFLSSHKADASCLRKMLPKKVIWVLLSIFAIPMVILFYTLYSGQEHDPLRYVSKKEYIEDQKEVAELYHKFDGRINQLTWGYGNLQSTLDRLVNQQDIMFTDLNWVKQYLLDRQKEKNLDSPSDRSGKALKEK